MPDDVIPIRCPVCNCDSNAAAWDKGCPTCAHLRSVKDRERRELAAEIAQSLAKRERRDLKDDDKQMFTVPEVAKDIRCNEERIRDRIKTGQIRAITHDGRVYLISSEEKERLKREGLPPLVEPAQQAKSGRSKSRRRAAEGGRSLAGWRYEDAVSSASAAASTSAAPPVAKGSPDPDQE